MITEEIIKTLPETLQTVNKFWNSLTLNDISELTKSFQKEKNTHGGTATPS